MRIATWNVNSVRARMERLIPWLVERRPDIVLLQETKCRDEEFPRGPLEELGYQVVTHGQKSYNGVAILTLLPIEDVVRGFGDARFDAEARVLGATVGDLLLLDVYVVNGQEVGAPKYSYKLEWIAALRAFVQRRYGDVVAKEKLVLAGDFNVTFDDRDVYDPEAWREKILCSTREREALAGVTSLGLFDALRRFHSEAGIYTWWDFRTRGFQRGQGLRIDHFLVSQPALEACTAIEVDLAARQGEKASDHAPVIVSLT